MRRSQLKTKYLKTKTQTLDYTKNIKTFVVSYKGKKKIL